MCLHYNVWPEAVYCMNTIHAARRNTDFVADRGDWLTHRYNMKSTKVQNPRCILHILRSIYANARALCVHCACAGFGQKLYACALFIIDGLGHATWSSKMPVSRSETAPF